MDVNQIRIRLRLLSKQTHQILMRLRLPWTCNVIVKDQLWAFHWICFSSVDAVYESTANVNVSLRLTATVGPSTSSRFLLNRLNSQHCFPLQRASTPVWCSCAWCVWCGLSSQLVDTKDSIRYNLHLTVTCARLLFKIMSLLHMWWKLSSLW